MNLLFYLLFLLVFALFFYMYNSDKRYGLYLSIFTLFFSMFLPYVADYTPLMMLKLTLINITALVYTSGILFECVRAYSNQWLTWLLRINIACLIPTIHNTFLQFLLLLTTITTPMTTVDAISIRFKSYIIDKNAWVVLCTFVLGWYYYDNIYFRLNPSRPLTYTALLVPAGLHFIKYPYLESRLILLMLTEIFDAFNHRKSITNIEFT